MNIEDRNYYSDRRVRFRAPRHEAWRINERAMLAIVPAPLRRDCEDCDGCGEPCEAHGGAWSPELEEAHQEAESEAGTPLPRPFEVAVPFSWAVCGLCDGKGRHVNPSIDCGGISGEEFDADPEFAECYMRGDYDVTCSECNGRRVVPELRAVSEAERDALRALEAQEEDDAAYERECRAERMMGA